MSSPVVNLSSIPDSASVPQKAGSNEDRMKIMEVMEQKSEKHRQIWR